MDEQRNGQSTQAEMLKEKRKWQIAMRRYILEKQPSAQYAPYFGITIDGFRKWIALQFTEDLNWDNFGKLWQFEHIVPAQHFNLNQESELKLCWNFLNIRVKNELGPSILEVSGFAAMHYFREVFERTQLEIAGKMVEKLIHLQSAELPVFVREYLNTQATQWKLLSSLTGDSLLRINQGETLEHILLEQSILQKFGS